MKQILTKVDGFYAEPGNQVHGIRTAARRAAPTG